MHYRESMWPCLLAIGQRTEWKNLENARDGTNQTFARLNPQTVYLGYTRKSVENSIDETNVSPSTRQPKKYPCNKLRGWTYLLSLFICQRCNNRSKDHRWTKTSNEEDFDFMFADAIAFVQSVDVRSLKPITRWIEKSEESHGNDKHSHHRTHS